MNGRTILAGGLLLIGAAACSSKRVYQESTGGDVAVADGVVVEIQNDNFSDVDVYAVAGGGRQRLGTVTGNTSSQFAIRSSRIPSGQLRLVAAPIGGEGRASSGSLNVSPGNVIHFTVAPVLSQSSATVR